MPFRVWHSWIQIALALCWLAAWAHNWEERGNEQFATGAAAFVGHPGPASGFIAAVAELQGGVRRGAINKRCFKPAPGRRVQLPLYSHPLVQVSWMRMRESSGISGFNSRQIHFARFSLVGFSSPGRSFR